MPLLSTLVYRVLSTSGAFAVARRLRHGASVLCFHNVLSPAAKSEAIESSLHVPAEEFAGLIDWLADHYDVIPLSTAAASPDLCRGRRPSLALTFDDAYRGVLRNALPLLRQRGLPATIFAVSGSRFPDTGFWWDDTGVARLMTPEVRRRCLADEHGDGERILGALHLASAPPTDADRLPARWTELAVALGPDIELGAHSVTHRALPFLSDAELARELTECRATIAAQVGTEPRYFAYPYGLWDRRVRVAARAAGYAAAFTLEPGVCTQRLDPWALPRTNIPSGISLAAFEAWTAGFAPRRALL
jgi:peptidoglycan/xylan/chitin deacetylase (PgdA/CDA1 family)